LISKIVRAKVRLFGRRNRPVMDPLLSRAKGFALAFSIAFALAEPVANADNTADEAEVAFQRGNQHYVQRDYQAALASYFLSYRLVPNRNVLFNIARCYEALNRFNEAYRYYNDLDASDFSPEDRRQISLSLSRIRPRVALIHVATDPPGADVFVDREDLGSRGRSPQTLALDPGPHLIRVRSEGYRPAEVTATLFRGQQIERSFRLELIVGTVELTGRPAGAWVRDAPDGPVRTTIPGAVQLAPGKHLLYVGHPGFATSQVMVDVRADVTSSVEVALLPQPQTTGKVVVTSNRDKALVRVDGKEAGFTPTVLELPQGEHELEVSSQDLHSWSKRVSVDGDGEQTVSAELRYISPAVKAASKSLVSLDEAPASTTIITAEEIRAFGYTTLAEALVGIRGFFASDDRVYTRLGIRGFLVPGDTNTRVLILWDGHPMNEVWSGETYAARELNVDLGEVERIEVVRGPGSALYGTGAFLGVINLVPRQTLGRRTVEATGAVGALGSWRGHVAGAVQSGASRSAIFSASMYGASGARTTDLGADGLAFGSDDERASNASAKASWGPWSLVAYYNQRQKSIPTTEFGTVLNHSGTGVLDARGFAELRYERDLSDSSSLSVRAYYDASRYRGNWVYADQDQSSSSVGGLQANPVLVETETGRADWIGAEARYRFSLLDNNQLTMGAEAQGRLRVDEQLVGGPPGPPLPAKRRMLLSPYLLDEWRLHPRILLSAGLRVDKYLDVDIIPVSPRLALILWPYSGGLTKIVAGEAFRAPNVYELYYGDRTQLPALHLNPETITTIEVEHSHNINQEVRVTLAGYYNRIRQLVMLVPDAGSFSACGAPREPKPCVVFQNAQEALRALGAEAELRWQAGQYALLDLSYAYVALMGNFPSIEAQTPSHLASARLMLPIYQSSIRLAAQATYQSARRSPELRAPTGEALLVGFAISGEYEHLRYFAGVTNLLDVNYALPAGSGTGISTVPQYGRSFLIEVAGAF
jgi:outer membrane receptor for ferrienterochelin and colicins